MQSLWNRASQAHRCGCRVCSTSVNALGRRTTTAAGRRKATFAEIFTACYSSVFASAAVIDSLKKDKRRRELDQELEHARQELAELKEKSKSPSSLHSTNRDGLTVEQMDILWKAMKQIINERPYRKNVLYPATLTASSVTECLRKDYYDCPTQTMLQKGRHIDYDDLDRAILNESEQIPAPGSRTETHLRNETLRFRRLVNALLKQADRMDRTGMQSKSFEQASELLNCNTRVNYSFRSADPEAARTMTQELNGSLRRILATPMSLKEKIGRLCYNMLISTHVPDIHTYNTLIAGFDKYGLPIMSDQVIYSFFYGRYIKPTESTFVAILNHNKLRNRPGEFLLNMARITGMNEVGVKLRRRHQDSMLRFFERKWLMTERASKSRVGEYIMQHLPLTPELLEEMIRGLLLFKLFEQAAVLFVGCLKAGITLASNLLPQLLDECISALDWSASVRLVRGMSEFSRQWFQIMAESGHDGLQLINRVHKLLDLCGISIRGQSFHVTARRLQISVHGLSELISALNSTGIFLEPSSFMNKYDPAKSRWLQLESIRKEYIKVRKATKSIESKLLNADHGQQFREDCAVHISESALEQSKKLRKEFYKLHLSGQQTGEEDEQVSRSVRAIKTVQYRRTHGRPRIVAAQVLASDRQLTLQSKRKSVWRPHATAVNAGAGST
ncbi:hypothetical protein MY4038_000400 [Beauveria bassiana]